MTDLAYRAFISYSHADSTVAVWLHRALEAYRVPDHLVEKLALASNRLIPIFRDRDELPTAENLTSTITDALGDSEQLIVICSPAAATSRWVNQEISEFRRLRPTGQILCLLTDDPAQSLPPAITAAVGGVPLAADIRPTGDGRDDAKLRIVAGLLGVGFDELKQREAQRRQRRLVAIATGALAGMAVAVGLAASALLSQQRATHAEQRALVEAERANQEARTAERTLAFLLELLHASDPAQARGADVTVRAVLDRAATRVETELTGEVRVQARLEEAIGEVYEGLGLYDRAEPLYRRARAALAGELGNDDPATLSAAAHVAGIDWRLGRYDAAQPELERILATARATLGTAHPLTLRTQLNLANLHLRRAQYSRAEALYRETWEAYRRTRGEDDAATVGALNNLANVLDDLDREDAARELYKQVFERRRATLGADHPHTLGAALNLSSAYERAGLLDEAEAIAYPALAEMVRVLGEDHPDTLTMVANVAALDLSRGRYADAIARDRQVVAGRMRTLGPLHDQTLVARRNLGYALQVAGDLPAATAETAAAVEGLASTLGADHFLVLDSRAALALLWAMQDRNAEAKAEFEGVLPGLERAVGPRHRDVLEVLYNLACVAVRVGEREQALGHLERAVEQGLSDQGMLSDPDLAPLRGDPRFEALAERIQSTTATVVQAPSAR